MADPEKQIRLFRRAADQRLAAAEFLFQHGFHLDAVYLAGYTVECALKALILRWTPRRELVGVLEQLTKSGAKGHDFEYLKGVLKSQRWGQTKTDRETFGALLRPLKVVASWSTDLRYQVGTVRAGEARRFLDAARTLRDWCARS